MKIYISGKITGEKEPEKRFERIEKYLTEQGNIVVNPMKLPHNHDHTWESYMKECIKALLDCDCIFMLANWKQSKGAKIERMIAKKLNLKIRE